MMKNGFYFNIKVLFVFNIFSFCPAFFGYAGKRLDKKPKVIFKTHDVTNGKQITAIHILPIISKLNMINL